MENNDIVRLAIDSINGRVSGNFSASGTSEALRKAMIDANGGSEKISYKTFRRGNALFEIVEEMLPYIIRDGLKGDETIFSLVDYRNISEGDEQRFYTQDKSLFAVAKVGDGTTSVRRQRLNAGQSVTIDTQMRMVRVYEELNRLMSGRVDFNEFVTRVATSFTNQLRTDIVSTLEGVTSSSAGLNSTYVQSGSFADATMDALIAHVEAACNAPAKIIGTKTGLGKVASTATGAVSLASATSKEDLYNLGLTMVTYVA